MSTKRITLKLLLGIGFVIGTVIAAVDNLAFHGEASPIIIVAMLLATTSLLGWIFGWRGWPASAMVWVCVPLTHLIKHILGLPDTLHPNTYASILMLAVFTFVIAAFGSSCGFILHRLTHSTNGSQPTA
jgi:hypothetical protein